MSIRLPYFTNLPFAEQLNRLMRELDRAVRLDSPLIALALYHSEFVRAEAEAAVEEMLRGMGQEVERVLISQKQPDLPRTLRDKPNSRTTVYFASGVQFGGGKDGLNGYRALNIRREYFIEYKLRVVFWLTKEEMVGLSRHAPDFWAFRHRSVEFMEEPTDAQIASHRDALPQRNWTNSWEDLESIEAKIAYRQRLLTQLPDTPESTAARADLYYTLATLYRASRQFEVGIVALQEALPLAKRMNDARLQVKCYNELGEIYNDQGKYERALVPVKQALTISKAELGKDHPETAESLNNLAYLLNSMGQYGEARPLYERALAIRESQLGPEHPDTAGSLNNLALLLKSMGQYGEARPLYERALAIRESQLGPEHPDTATSLNNLAGLLRAMGQYEDARPLYERALVIAEKQLGPDHPFTATSLNNLAELLRAIGQYGEARPLHERALAIHEVQLGSEHPDTAQSLNNLAGLLKSMGLYGEARPLYERALAIFETSLGADHPTTKIVRANLAALP